MNQRIELISTLNKECQGLAPEEILEISIKKFNNKITYICSFGTESAIILHMISKIDTKFPIFLLNTHFLFPETIAYKNKFHGDTGYIYRNFNLVKKSLVIFRIWKFITCKEFPK